MYNQYALLGKSQLLEDTVNYFVISITETRQWKSAYKQFLFFS